MSRTAPTPDTSTPPRPTDTPDRTADTLAWLRARRGTGRARRFAYAAYVTLVLLVGWYGLFAAGLLYELRHATPLAKQAEAIARTLPSAAVTVALAGLALTAWDALWRGPVTPPRPDVDWLTALPVRRGPVLLPWFALSAGIWTLAALLVGFAGVLLLAAAGLGGIGRPALAVLPPAACLALLAVTGAALVQRSPTVADRLRRLSPLLAGAVLLSAAQTVAAAYGHRLPAVETAVLWSGPWGWAVQPVLAATGRPLPLWPVAAALLAVCTAVALASCGRIVADVPAAVLRSRARTVGGVLAALWAVDPRSVRLSMAAGPEGRRRGRLGRWAARLRPPRSPGPLVAWRDTVALLMAPGRPALSVLLLLLAGAVLRAGGGAVSLASLASLASFASLAPVVAAALGYVAAAVLLEPARLDADDPRRTAWSPRPYARVALDHALVPTILLTTVGCLLTVPFAPATGPLLALAAGPVLVATGLVSAYRAPVPAWLMFSGPALAGAGPLLSVLWHASGPTTGVLGLALLLGAPYGWAVRVAACWLLALSMLWWAWARARAHVR